MEQISFFEDIDEKRKRRCVIKELKYYKALRVRMQNRQEQNAADTLFCFCQKCRQKQGQNGNDLRDFSILSHC